MPNPKLRNYSTTVPAAKSIGEVHELLVDFGADKIAFMNEERRTVGIAFVMQTTHGPAPFKLPLAWDKVLEYIWQEYWATHTRYPRTKADFTDEAYNVAWRILRDWLHSQLSIIATEQVKTEQVFLPYLMVNSEKTLAESFSEGSLSKLLPRFEETVGAR
jgi:hypothetical protein